MRRLFACVVLAALGGAAACHAPVKTSEPDRILIDHDAGAEDLIAMTMLVRSAPEDVMAVTVSPADSLPESAMSATRNVLAAIGASAVPVFASALEGANHFPDDWRKDAGRVLALRSVAGVTSHATVNTEDAPHAIARMLATGGPVTIVETGPLSNIAAALALDPSIVKRITRIVVMGGALRTAGNVDQPGHDGTAEWNIYNDPAAAAAVLSAGVPMTLIPLDATNKMPVTSAFIEQVIAQRSVASRFAADAWSLGSEQIKAGQYYFWDTLTAAAAIDPWTVTTEAVHVRVITSGTSQGRIVEDPNGKAIQVALSVDRAKAEQVILSMLAR